MLEALAVRQERSRERAAAASTQSRRFTPEEAREIRLSLLSNSQEAKKRGTTTSVIEKLRAGVNYGQLKPDERAAADRRKTGEVDQRAESTFQTFHAFKVGRVFPVRGRPDLADRFDWIEALDAAHECSHGRLPGDRSPVCGCWPHREGFGVVVGDRQDDEKEAAA